MSFGSSTTEMAAASSFSYAQAAKGQGTPAQSQAANQSAASEMNGTDDAPSAPVEEKSSSSQEPSSQTAHSAPSTDTSTTSAERHDNDSVSAVSEAQTTESAPEKRPEAKRDGEVSRLDQPWRQAEKSARSSSAATRSVDEQDSRRQRKGRKGKPAEKQAGDATPSSEQSKDEPEAPKIELSEAPIPTVNIWQQRKAAQVKPKSETPATASSVPIDQNAGPKPAANNSSNAKSTSDVNGVKPAPRPAEKSERNGSRGNRIPIRETRDPKAGAPPSVADAVSWPTPETATSEEPKKVAEKAADKEVKDESAPKPRQKNEWVKYDYVPTVAFETQLPQMRSSKPRGGAKGTGSSRSSTAAQGGEKATATTPTKSTETRDRTREAGSAGGRNSSQPPASKRAPTEGAPARGEQRKPAHNTAGDRVKDVASSQQTEQQPAAREPRSERGRGGYRGRGGHHSLNGHSQHQSSSNATGASFSNGNMGSRTSGPYSPPLRGGHGQGQMYMPPAPRGGRGARGGNNYHRMSLPNGGTRLPPVQTHYAPYDYQMPMSAVAYPQTPYMDPMLAGVLLKQIEYYFSIENLCKDVFLRRHMDGQGYVPLLFITAFKRMREIASDISIVRAVCEASEVIDYIVEPDGTERLRRRDGWQTWVLPTQERDELARTDGPAKVTYKSRAYQYPQQGQFNGMQSPYGMGSQQEYHQQHFADAHSYNMANGMPNGNGAATQLSAEVPDFAPAQAAGLPNGHVSAAAVNGVAHDDNAQAAGLS